MEPIPSKMKIGVDLDDTLCEFVQPLLLFLNSKLQKSVSINDIKYYSFEHYYSVSVEEIQKLINEFLFLENCSNLEPIPYAFQALQNIKTDLNCEFIIITSRDYRLKDATIKWVDKYFPNIFTSIEFCNTFGLDTYPKFEKYEICSKLGINILIDDQFHHLHKCVEEIPNFFPIIFTQPWNIDITQFWRNHLGIKSFNLRSCYQNKWQFATSETIIKILEGPLLDRIFQYDIMEDFYIGLSGKIGSGKDTVADIIEKHFQRKVDRRSFATRLKEVVAVLTRTSFDMNLTQKGKEYVPDSCGGKSLGELQQIIGENFRNNINIDIWVNCAFEDKPVEYKIKLFTDVRLVNEAVAIEKRNGLLIRINGDPGDVRKNNVANRDLNHISETALDDWKFEHVIENNGTKKELKKRVLEILYPYFFGLLFTK